MRERPPTSDSATKLPRYKELVQARKECRACGEGLVNPSACAGGRYDSAHVGPWSRWQGNLDATVMVIGQDWADRQTFECCEGRDNIRNQTNKTLLDLLALAGLSIDPDHDGGAGSVFLTNAILCLKEPPSMQAPIRWTWVKTCGDRFLKPTIDVIAPAILVTLGKYAYRSVARLYQLQQMTFRTAVEDPGGFRLSERTQVFPMYHCGARVLRRHRPLEQQRQDWLRVSVALRAVQPPA